MDYNLISISHDYQNTKRALKNKLATGLTGLVLLASTSGCANMTLNGYPLGAKPIAYDSLEATEDSTLLLNKTKEEKKEEQGVKGFFKKHWGKMIVGTIIAGGIAGLVYSLTKDDGHSSFVPFGPVGSGGSEGSSGPGGQ